MAAPEDAPWVHIGLTPYCGLCGATVAPRERCKALVDQRGAATTTTVTWTGTRTRTTGVVVTRTEAKTKAKTKTQTTKTQTTKTAAAQDEGVRIRAAPLPSFPDWEHEHRCLDGSRAKCGWCLAGEALCRRPGCADCAAAPEAVTVHLDCLALFRRHDEHDEQLWVLSAWRRAWRRAPNLWLDEDEAGGMASAARLAAEAEAALLAAGGGEQEHEHEHDSLGRILGLLRRLPHEIVHMIRLRSADSPLWRYGAVLALVDSLPPSAASDADTPASLPLCEIAAWERGARPTTMAMPPPASAAPAVIRLTIDARGLRTVERLPSAARLSRTQLPSSRRGFVVADESHLRGATVRFRFGRARLELPAGLPGLHVWDTPAPPPSLAACRLAPASLVAASAASRHAIRLRTVPLDRASGVTLFFFKRRAYGIHVHTAAAPCATATLELLPRRPWEAAEWLWLYVPIAAGDRVTAFGARGLQRDYARTWKWLYVTFSFLLRMQLAGDVVVGPMHTRYDTPSEDTCFAAAAAADDGDDDGGAAPNAMLVYHTDEREPVSVCGGYVAAAAAAGGGHNDERPAAIPPFPARTHPDRRARDAYWSEAPLDGVVRVQVFLGGGGGVTRGLVLHYADGGARALGECRVGGAAPVRDCDRPAGLCVWRTTYVLPSRGEANPLREGQYYRRAVRVEAAAAAGPHDHGDEAGWVCWPLRGRAEFWVGHGEADLSVFADA